MENGWLALKTLIFFALVPGIVAGVVPWQLALHTHPGIRFDLPTLRWVAPLFWAAGLLVLARCGWDFVMTGHGTPAPIDPPKELVATGFYRHSRNPMYLGVLIVLTGHVFYAQSLWLLLYTGGVFAAFQAFVVFYEEPKLTALFGDTYREYLHRTPRWLGR